MTLAAHTMQNCRRPGVLMAPTALRGRDISVVIPVRNDTLRLTRLLRSFSSHFHGQMQPREIVVVDDGSSPAVPASVISSAANVPTQLVFEDGRGPAAARNTGAKMSTGEWLLFVDSDCICTPTTISGYAGSLNGSVAYAGDVRALGADRLSSYYSSQKTLVPPENQRGEPSYLVTANCLVWREAFDKISGFSETCRLAGGEDIDLALRLGEWGALGFAPRAVILHDFDDGYLGFLRRFVRYGRGNQQLDRQYRLGLCPRPFSPEEKTSFNRLASAAQFVAMSFGYWTETFSCNIGKKTRFFDWFSKGGTHR